MQGGKSALSPSPYESAKYADPNRVMPFFDISQWAALGFICRRQEEERRKGKDE